MNPIELDIRPHDIDHAVAAARAGDHAALRAWLRAGGDPNRHDAEGWTPLLAGAVRGHEAVVDLLLSPEGRADPDLRHPRSGALAIHFAGHSGSVAVADRLLAARPGHLEAVWDINGHTLLLQAVFYGHLELAEYAVGRGASTAATTLRGLAALELAEQFQNGPMIALLRPHDASREAKGRAYEALLRRIAPLTPPDELEAQVLADELVQVVTEGLARVDADPTAAEAALDRIRDLVEVRGADVNRLGGVLRQPPLVVAVTGNNGTPPSAAMAGLRLRVAARLLEHGADPTLREVHPMGVHAIIRAAVFNHLDILRLMGRYLSAQALADALNEKPVVNGLTALHDTVLRASTAGPDRIEGYLDQIRWAVGCGARWDIEDFSGRTQRAIAERTADPEARQRILEALGS